VPRVFLGGVDVHPVGEDHNLDPIASGITKVASGSFVSGMADALKETRSSAPHWHRSFLDGTVIPDARTFAVLIEVGEIVVGVAFIAAAVTWLAGGRRLSDGYRTVILVVTMLAALGATFMALNFHLANGANHPWLIPREGFDETIDLDAFLVLIQAVLFFFCCYLLAKSRHQRVAAPLSGPSS
jgi:hypothetical protein